MTAAMNDRAGRRLLVRKVARIVREMPLWRLQRIGAEQLNFLYEKQATGAQSSYGPESRFASASSTPSFPISCVARG
jgi:hypothetical protein